MSFVSNKRLLLQGKYRNTLMRHFLCPGVVQGCVLDPPLFISFVSNKPLLFTRQISKYADDTKVIPSLKLEMYEISRNVITMCISFDCRICIKTSNRTANWSKLCCGSVEKSTRIVENYEAARSHPTALKIIAKRSRFQFCYQSGKSLRNVGIVCGLDLWSGSVFSNSSHLPNLEILSR